MKSSARIPRSTRRDARPAARLGVDPSQIPSNLIGKRVPVFSLPPVPGRTLGLSSDLHGEVSLINVFASRCVACREEHPLLLAAM
jgi:cytochrome c biogenesis protein CcmG, thiol:disulfide interchange protein DsbE